VCAPEALRCCRGVLAEQLHWRLLLRLLLRGCVGALRVVLLLLHEPSYML